MTKNSSLDRFCGSTFWDSNLTWYTNNPDLTPCFQKTVLAWIPCMYLWVASLFEIYNMYKSKERDIPWNKLNITKLVVLFLLIMLQIADIGQIIDLSSRGDEEIYAADFYGAAVKLLTFCLVATVICYNRKYGLRTSGALFFFWLLLIFAGLPQLRTEMIHYSSSNDSNSRYNFASYIVYYSLIIFMFLLNCFADLPPSNSRYSYTKNRSPEDHSGFPSRLTFSWFDPLAWTGYRRSLVEDDLWPLNPQLVSKEAAQKFEKFWERATKKRGMTVSHNMNSNDLAASDEPQKQVSLLPIVCKAFGAQFVFAMILKLANDLLTFASPKLLEFLIGFIEGNEPVWRGYLYATGMFISSIIQSMLLGQYFIRTTVVGVKIKNSLCTAIYKKALRLSNTARKNTTVGELINLMSTDVDRFSNLMFINLVWSAPLQITLSVYFLWGVLGPSVLAGVAVIIVLMPVNGVVAGFQEKLQTRMMVYKDERIKLMNEVLNGIKVLKMYAWEPSFQSHIMKIRNKEMKLLKKLAYLNSATSFIWFCTPFLVSLMSFTCFVLVNDTEVLNSKRAFVALSLFNIMRFPMTLLPNVISDIIQTSVSIKRLNKLLNSEELDDGAVEHNPDESEQIIIENGHFTWGNYESELVLKEINLRISEGSLVAIVGTVGTGKSSLLSAILGEMNKVSGRVNVKGQVAYVPQQAWIQNATIQDNILFGKPLDRIKYNNILDVCALTADLEILAGGDQTEIGEKGINLSGGQKQRIALARAVYYGAENYLLDDPLSAVDSHVGKHIFDKVIGPNGQLKHKTRVWVTNNVSYLSQTDMVVVLRDGKVSEVGSYHHLLENKGAFAEFLLHHLSLAEKNSSLQDLKKIKQDLETNLGSEFERKLQWARSVSTIESEGGATEAGDHSDLKKIEEVEKGNDEYVDDVNKLIETETTETGRVKWSVYMHYLTNVGVVASLATVAMQIILHSLQIGGNFWLAEWSNDDSMLINGTVDPERRDMYLGVYGGFGIAQAISSFLADLMPFLACWRAAKILHSIMLDNMLKAPLQFFEVTPIGRILSRFSKDVDVVDSALPWQISNVLSSSFEVIGTLFVISYSTPMFIIVIIPIGVLYYLIQRFYVPTSRQIMRIESVARSPVYSHFSESILGAASIRAFGVMDRFVTRSQHKVDHYQSFSYLSAVADRWLGVRLEIICSLIIFFAALFTVIERDKISPGIAGLSVSYTLEITQTLSWLVQMASGVETDIVAVERMKEYGETEQEAAWIVPQSPRPSWPETGALHLDRVTISYRGGKPALRDLTCSVTPRDKIGIVGRTGAGKSTLTLGLFRIVEPTGGRILVDGLDVSTIGLHQLRSRITIIPQDPVLFSGTLRMNLDPFEAHTDAELWRALEHAHLKPFVEGLEAGLLHEVSEGGENLSLGQRQLVCLARALLRKTRLLVLDEATAAVDLETDELIQKTIRTEFASCTVLTIAHRLNTIMDSTKVMVLDKGQLVEYAPPQELLKNKDSVFYTLARNAGLV